MVFMRWPSLSSFVHLMLIGCCTSLPVPCTSVILSNIVDSFFFSEHTPRRKILIINEVIFSPGIRSRREGLFLWYHITSNGQPCLESSQTCYTGSTTAHNQSDALNYSLSDAGLYNTVILVAGLYNTVMFSDSIKVV